MYEKIRSQIDKESMKEAEHSMLEVINEMEQTEGKAVMIRYDYEALSRLCDNGFPELDIKISIGDYIDRINERYSENLRASMEQAEEVYKQFKKIINSIYEDIDEEEARTI